LLMVPQEWPYPHGDWCQAARHSRRILGQRFRLIAGGNGARLAIALLLSRVLKSSLFGVGAADPLTLIGVGAAFAAVAMLACWVPTRRAGKVDPLAEEFKCGSRF
jgi:putative ABC transport system permease protein